MKRLIDYFQNEEDCVHALNRYLKFAEERNWNVGGEQGKLHLYQVAKRAFCASTSPEEAAAAFETLYDVLRKYWQIGRKGELATPAVIFQTIVQQGSNCLPSSSARLGDLRYPSAQSNALKYLLLPTSRFPYRRTRCVP
jgi:hypothetical protein